MSEAPKPEEISSLANNFEEEPKSIDEMVSEEERKKIREEGLREVETLGDDLSRLVDDVKEAFDKFQYNIAEVFTRASPDKMHNQDPITYEATVVLHEEFSNKFSSEAIEKVNPVGHIQLDIEEFKTVFSRKFEQYIKKEHGSIEEARAGSLDLFNEMKTKVEEEFIKPLNAFADSAPEKLKEDASIFKKKVFSRGENAKFAMHGIDSTGRKYYESSINQFYMKIGSFSEKLESSLDVLNKSIKDVEKNIRIRLRIKGEAAIRPLEDAYASKQREIDGV